ncbi:PRTRC system protein F [Burkholderia gladioli]|uniref:PRTRC system protein F n=1 Tax=Burkholderia gladioli TaxID=28095 RepID=UPI00163EA814|nr:PRTRC system protein F [Burkholderia gladioli]
MTPLPLVLPTISPKVPTRYVTGSDRHFIRGLALALVNGRVVTKADAERLGESTDERKVAEGTIYREWQEITSGLRWFDWNLRVVNEGNPAKSAWFLIHSGNGIGNAPVRFIGAGIQRLERAVPGLGQTVLAVLYETCAHYLPSVLTPQETLGLAEYMYWYGEADEFAAMDELALMYDLKIPKERTDEAIDEFFAQCDTPRRREFFPTAPEWACYPQRVLTADEVACAHTRTNDIIFVDAVVHACDAIHAIVNSGRKFARVNCSDAGEHGIDYATFLLWEQEDGTGRVLDDFWNNELQGDYLEASAAIALPFAGKAIGNWFERMHNTAALARATEELISFLSVDAEEDAPAQRVEVRV